EEGPGGWLPPCGEGGGFHRTEFRAREKRHRTAAKTPVEEEEQGANRGKDRRSTGGAINRQHDRKCGRNHGRARRFGYRMPDGGIANHPAPYCEELSSPGQAGHNRDSVIRIDD